MPQKVLAVVPVYNGELSIIIKAIRSILSQNYPFLKIVVIDDYSEESLYSPLSKALSDIPQVILVRNEENIGFAQTLNRGLEFVTDETYFLVLEQDCELLGSTYVTDAIKYFNNASVGVVSGENLLPPVDELSLMKRIFVNHLCENVHDSSVVEVGFSLLKADIFRIAAIDKVGGFESSSKWKFAGEEHLISYKIQSSGYKIFKDYRLKFRAYWGGQEKILQNLRKEAIYGRGLGWALGMRKTDLATGGSEQLKSKKLCRIMEAQYVFLTISSLILFLFFPFLSLIIATIPASILFIYLANRASIFNQFKEKLLFIVTGFLRSWVYIPNFFLGFMYGFLIKNKKKIKGILGTHKVEKGIETSFSKIVMVAPFGVSPKGTVPIRMLPIAKRLISFGHEVSIIVPPYDNLFESGKEYKLDNVKIINVIFKNFPLIKYPLTLFRLWRRIFNLRPQYVYVFKPKGYSGLVAMLIALLRQFGVSKNLRLILDTDDWEGWGGFCDYYSKHSVYPNKMLDFFDFQERWIPKHVDGITVASRELEKRLLNAGISPKRIFYVPNGAPQRNFNVDRADVVDLRKQLKLEKAPVILLYTRFFEYNVKKIIKIFKSVQRELENVKLLVVGKGDFGEEKTLQNLALENGLQNSLVYSGWIQPEEIPLYLALGDVAIYPFDDTSLNKAKCPGKLIELMLAGKAIIAEKVGQIPEYIIHDESGILVKPNDLESFISGIVKLLKDRELRNKLGNHAKMRVERVFNWEKIAVNVKQALLSPILTRRSTEIE